MIQSKHGRLKAIHYLKQAYEHVSLMAELPNTIDSGSVEKEQTMLDQRA
jgi:hypothetical protein